MNSPSSIGRRLASALAALQKDDFEGACTHIFPALDKTAKLRRPKDGVGERIKKFIADQEGIISIVATGSRITGISVNGINFPNAIYKFGRTSIVHEGELDPRLKFSRDGALEIGETWHLPASYIVGLCVAIMSAKENAKERAPIFGSMNILGKMWEIDSIWGSEAKIEQAFEEKFSRYRSGPV